MHQAGSVRKHCFVFCQCWSWMYSVSKTFTGKVVHWFSLQHPLVATKAWYCFYGRVKGFAALKDRERSLKHETQHVYFIQNHSLSITLNKVLLLPKLNHMGSGLRCPPPYNSRVVRGELPPLKKRCLRTWSRQPLCFQSKCNRENSFEETKFIRGIVGLRMLTAQFFFSAAWNVKHITSCASSRDRPNAVHSSGNRSSSSNILKKQLLNVLLKLQGHIKHVYCPSVWHKTNASHPDRQTCVPMHSTYICIYCIYIYCELIRFHRVRMTN